MRPAAPTRFFVFVAASFLVSCGEAGVDAVKALLSDSKFEEARLLLTENPDLLMQDEENSIQAFVAASGQLDFLKFILEIQPDANFGSPLLSAVKNDRVEVADFLVGRGADTAMLDDDGRSFVLRAYYEEREDWLRFFLSRGALRKHIGEAVYAAAREGHSEFLEILIKAGGDTTHETYEGLRPLLVSAILGRTGQARVLTAQGADVNRRVSAKSNDFRAMTALHFAAAEGHADFVDWALSSGAKVDAVDRWGYTPLARAVEIRDAEDNAKLSYEPLHRDRTDWPRLLRESSDIERTPEERRRDYTVVIETLLAHGAAPAAALLNPSPDVAELLIASGANPLRRIRIDSDQTFIEIWTMSKDGALLALAIRHGFHTQPDEFMNTPLHILAEAFFCKEGQALGIREVKSRMIRLVADGAKIEAKNAEGEAPRTVFRKSASEHLGWSEERAKNFRDVLEDELRLFEEQSGQLQAFIEGQLMLQVDKLLGGS